jgi:hypothetical protein
MCLWHYFAVVKITQHIALSPPPPHPQTSILYPGSYSVIKEEKNKFFFAEIILLFWFSLKA